MVRGGHGYRIVEIVASGPRDGWNGVVKGDDVAGDQPEGALSFGDLQADKDVKDYRGEYGCPGKGVGRLASCFSRCNGRLRGGSRESYHMIT